MCPVSGLVQFLIVLVVLLLMCHAAIVKSCEIAFNPKNATIHMYDSVVVEYNISDQVPHEGEYLLYSEDSNIASLDKEYLIISNDNLSGTFNVTGNFLGKTVISCKKNGSSETSENSEKMDIVVVRKLRVIDVVFTASVATLISLLYVNFGCAIDWSEFKTILKKPIGPAIGLFGHFVIMPVLSYVLGLLLFPDNAAMQLGLFFTGVSPAGGASTVWTILLGGNLSLSVSMTAASTMAAFAFMPLWIFTLGRVIFKNAKLEVPYTEIMTYVVALVVPLAVGYLIQRYLKGLAKFMIRIIKGFSSLLILFIIVFAIITNLYLFKLFSWQIIVGGLGIPWIGYIAGYLMSKILGQNPTDCLTTAIEVGIQNTGIAIFLLRFALPQPEGDLTTVAPVAVAVLTPFPLMILYIIKKLRSRFYHSHSKLSQEEIVKVEDSSNYSHGTDINGIS